ncbi:MAG: Ig-like domain-containing protein [Acidobacteria bacterium]|nr:Ig-like domain-containing protein [Acidobacteriota bacterium]
MRFAFTVWAAVLACAAAGPPEIRLETGGFVVRRLPDAAAAQACRAFAVFVDTGAADTPPLLGSCSIADGSLLFQPRFPLQPGLRYHAVLRGTPAVEARFEIPRSAGRPARVDAVFPSASHLPENQLKLYVQFSAPMSRGEAYRRVSLLDEGGEAVELPFLELEQELWDPAGKRLTLLFDPGRIKRGLVPRQEVGPALKAGRRYTLVIDRGWPDAVGTPLAEPFRKQFTAGEADRTTPDPAAWRISAPAADSRAPVEVRFPEAMDRALLERLLVVKDPAGHTVAGAVAIDDQERRWRFTPQSPWRRGSYTLQVGAALEDLAGNRIGHPFDVDRFERVTPEVQPETLGIRFEVR